MPRLLLATQPSLTQRLHSTKTFLLPPHDPVNGDGGGGGVDQDAGIGEGPRKGQTTGKGSAPGEIFASLI